MIVEVNVVFPPYEDFRFEEKNELKLIQRTNRKRKKFFFYRFCSKKNHEHFKKEISLFFFFFYRKESKSERLNLLSYFHEFLKQKLTKTYIVRTLFYSYYLFLDLYRFFFKKLCPLLSLKCLNKPFLDSKDFKHVPH